ncbi:MAG: hypothetical protein WC470_02760 [Candidatus Paceibacterota bacterium]
MTNEESLKEIEDEVRTKAEITRKARKTLADAHRELRESVHAYKDARTKMQKDSWKNKGLALCYDCSKLYPQEDITLFYIERLEKRGSHYRERMVLIRKVQGCCRLHANNLLNRAKGGEDKFQCFEVRQEGEEFFIVNGLKTIPIPFPKETAILIEWDGIPEREFEFGKQILFNSSHNELTMGEERIL